MTKPKNRVYCRSINRLKILFDSEAAANRFIKFNQDSINEGKDKPTKLRSYYCITCGGYHVTHLPYNEMKIKKVNRRVNSVIDSFVRKKKKEVNPDLILYEYILGLNIKSFGSKKKVKKYISEHTDEAPKPVDRIFTILNLIHSDYFKSKDLVRFSTIEIHRAANELFTSLPLEKLTDKSLIDKYIELEIQPNCSNPLILLKLNEIIDERLYCENTD